MTLAATLAANESAATDIRACIIKNAWPTPPVGTAPPGIAQRAAKNGARS